MPMVRRIGIIIVVDQEHIFVAVKSLIYLLESITQTCLTWNYPQIGQTVAVQMLTAWDSWIAGIQD